MPSPAAPYEFAEKVRVRFGLRLAPTSLTHEGKSFVPVGEFACAKTGVATAEADARAKNQISMKRLLRALFVIFLAIF